MKFLRASSPLLVLAALSLPVFSQAQAGQTKEVDLPTSKGLVAVEVERSALPWLFPLSACPQQVTVSRGMGFVARADGVIVTSKELVEGADRITVALQDGRRLAGEVATLDEETHTALLRVDAWNLPALELREPSDPLLPGDHLVLGRSVKGALPSGVYTGRAGEACDEREGALLALFSGALTIPRGAPLLSEEGRVVGLNATFTTLPLPVGQDLQFVYATPADDVRELVASLPLQGPLPLPPLEGPDWDWGRSWVFPEWPVFALPH